MPHQGSDDRTRVQCLQCGHEWRRYVGPLTVVIACPDCCGQDVHVDAWDTPLYQPQYYSHLAD
jgi:Zn finger protein HypA/HybF involved in hydrogenase expression